MDNVCNRRLFSISSKAEMAQEQEYLVYFTLALDILTFFINFYWWDILKSL